MARTEILLDRQWKFCADSAGTGRERGYASPVFDDSAWLCVDVPSTFESVDPGLIGYKGICWYRRHFQAGTGAGRILLGFDAVNTNCTIWLNGSLAGSHSCGYLPFQIDITDQAADGDNLLAVSVDNRLRPGQLPTLHFWRNHGGIIRDVKIRHLDDVYIDRVQVETRFESGHVHAIIRTRLVNAGLAALSLNLSHSIAGLDCRMEKPVRLEAGSQQLDVSTLDLTGAAFWQPDQPVLYSLATRIDGGQTSDTCISRFGCRTIQAGQDQILLNGQPIFLQGFNRHEDSVETDLALNRRISRADLVRIKQMGANFVRFCHYPHSEYELDVCDEIGLLVMDEIPFNAALVPIQGVDPDPVRRNLSEVYRNARAAVDRLIERDYNHPCVVFWSAGNESNEQDPKIRDINNALLQYIRQSDDTRLAVHISQGCHWYGDLIGDLFRFDDVICINAYATMEGRLHQQDRAYAYADTENYWIRHRARLTASYPGKPVLVTEFGYPTDSSFDACADQQVQAEVIVQDFQIMRPYVNGGLIWCYADHGWELDDRTRAPLFGAFISPYGIFRRDREPKDAVAAVEAAFKQSGRPAT